MFISPMLLARTDHPFDDDNYIFEPKIDGHRLILSHTNGKTRLYTRHNNDVTNQYPELHLQFHDDIILDGEVACVEPATGAIDFEAVMERFTARKSEKVRTLCKALPVNYIAFDILMHKGKDLRQLPLMKRKEILAQINLSCAFIGKIPFIEQKGEYLFNEICARRMEGIVAKRKESRYVSERSDAWLKIINWTYADVFITGYRKSEFGWMASVMDSGKLRPAGIIRYGATPAQKMAFYTVCQTIKMDEDEDTVYLEPKVKASVKMRNWTRNGMMRNPVFVDFIV